MYWDEYLYWEKQRKERKLNKELTLQELCAADILEIELSDIKDTYIRKVYIESVEPIKEIIPVTQLMRNNYGKY